MNKGSEMRIAAPPNRLGQVGQRIAEPPKPREGNSSHPEWLRPSKIPLTLVAGPPGSGKSTYVREHAQVRDRIICFDEIATRIFGRSSNGRVQASLSHEAVIRVLRARNEMLADLTYARSRERWDRAWLIASEPKAEDREFWATQMSAHVLVLPVDAEECRRRIAIDNSKGDKRGEGAIAYIDNWWRLYRPALCDNVICP